MANISYDTAMYKNFFKAIRSTKKDCVRYLKDNYVVRKTFWTDQAVEIKVGSSENPKIISCYKENDKFYHEYMFDDPKLGLILVTTAVHKSCIDFIPDGYLEKSIEVIKAYCNHRLGTNFPEITLISNKKYSIHLWE